MTRLLPLRLQEAHVPILEDCDDSEGKKKGPSRFMAGGASDSDSDDDAPRIVKSAKDQFDKLLRLVQRQTNLSDPVPSFFLELLKSLEKDITDAQNREKSAAKKMNATNARALNGMKQKLRKSTKEYEVAIKSFEEDPDKYRKEENKEPVKKGDEEEEDPTFKTVGRSGKTMTFSTEALFKNLLAIQEARGKKNTDRNEQIHLLERVLPTAVTPYGKIRVLLTLISARFDYNPTASFMPIELWKKALREINNLIELLITEPLYIVTETTEDYDESVERVPTDGKPVVVRGSIVASVERIEDEFNKSLLNIDPHGTEYVERLKDEPGLYALTVLAQRYFEVRKLEDAMHRVIIKRLEHIYCKPDAVIQHFESNLPNPPSPLPPTSELIASLATKLYKSPSPLLRTRAMLAHIYHTGLQNDFPRARDMLLMSHVQESINSADAQTQILFNRAVVQLGLSAFRRGMIKEAHGVLGDIFATQRVKELLAQGTGPRGTETPAATRVLLPFHVHINTELAEAVFLVSCDQQAVPSVARVCRPPGVCWSPESTRDCVVQATRALLAGEWERCKELIVGIKIWSLMGAESEGVKEMLGQRIQEESLRTYLFTYSPHYTSLSLEFLQRTFSLSASQTTSIVSRMIWNDELASLDSAAKAVVFRRTEVNRTQASALALAERAANLVEMTEKALDMRVGGREGGGGWGDRGDREGAGLGGGTGAGGEGRRRGGQGRPRGGGGGSGRGGRFAQGLGSRMGVAGVRARNLSNQTRLDWQLVDHVVPSSIVGSPTNTEKVTVAPISCIWHLRGYHVTNLEGDQYLNYNASDNHMIIGGTGIWCLEDAGVAGQYYFHMQWNHYVGIMSAADNVAKVARCRRVADEKWIFQFVGPLDKVLPAPTLHRNIHYPFAPGHYVIRNVGTDTVMHAEYGSGTGQISMRNVIAQWYVVPTATGTAMAIKTQTRGSGYLPAYPFNVFDVAGANPADGTKIVLWPRTGEEHQKWYFEPA
ncbi:eukaryotic translation initiation factor 3 subunit 8 [Rhizoctonia solani]|uniref:Eukaryotic translation initiation factor 3 subunit C n=1 Tax=Rhizoctonia solani TaxID=456999 RepID=A0A8H8SXS5_9AGAM|nr:eukaryotic translation initiation factor 3 subunit 8 [Rhizoctonia solani]QRW21819.1 eukaryotic translation initiation factor 3 subunit 8 [Rhizoctonia solani]